jgi:hypothetical protein
LYEEGIKSSSSCYSGVDVALLFMPKIFADFTMPAIILVLARIAS